MNETMQITILSVSFKSSFHLKRLFLNLVEKADNPTQIKFLIVDNTNGKDPDIKNLSLLDLNIKIIPNLGLGMQRSISHASALDIGLKAIQTKYCLIIDPDTHIFKKKWDSFCINKIKDDKAVIGAPYPQWKLGKVHDFPSVIFMFFKTENIRKFGKSFYPFPSRAKRVYNYIFRKFTRIGIFTSKSILNKNKCLRLITYYLESIFGVTSPDTGREVIESFRLNGFRSINFRAPYSFDQSKKGLKVQSEIAKEFELYIYDGESILTHMYSSGVFHWKTKRGSNFNYWQYLINKIENKYEN